MIVYCVNWLLVVVFCIYNGGWIEELFQVVFIVIDE